MRRRISQREAHGLRRKVKELEADIEAVAYKRAAQLAAWRGDYPGGVNIASLNLADQSWGVFKARLETATKLDLPIIVKLSGSSAHFYAVRS